MVWKNGPSLRKRWKLIFCLLTPLLFLPFVFIPDENNKFRCLYVILLMGSWWMTEAIPLPVTALLPVPLFPVLGIMPTGQVAGNYMKETGMMFLGGISLALGIEKSGLHKRIALNMMKLIGISPWRILLGVMVTTFTLSGWIVGNTAVTAMMIPIVSGLVESLEDPAAKKKLRVLYMLAVGYAANIGGTSIMIGSIPNLLFKDLAAQEYIRQNSTYTEINFFTWMAFNIPIALMNLLIVFLLLGFRFLHLRKGSKRESRTELADSSTMSMSDESAERIGQTLKAKLKGLGGITRGEKWVLLLFLVAILLWFTREPQLFPGWASLFPTAIGDSSVAVFILLIMFLIPDGNGSRDSDSERTLMTWDYLLQNFPWGVVLLVGGGFAISDGAQVSGLSDWVGEQLNSLTGLGNELLLFVVLMILSVFTEIASNAASVSLLTPLLFALGKKKGLHPLFLSFPGAIASQYAFILPTSNPPNALVFSAGGMRVKDMVKPGIPLNFLCLSVLFIMTISWGEVVFKFSQFDGNISNNSTITNSLSS